MADRWRKPLGWLMNAILPNSYQNHVTIHRQRSLSDTLLNAHDDMFYKTVSPGN